MPHVMKSMQRSMSMWKEKWTKRMPQQLMPLIREHLDLCPECCEEYEALLDVLEKTSKKSKMTGNCPSFFN